MSNRNRNNSTSPLIKRSDNYLPVSDGGYYLTIMGKKYAIDLDQLKKFCIIPSKDKEKETESEVIVTYEADLKMSSKVLRELKMAGNPQSDMITYDIVKLFIERLLNNGSFVDNADKELDVSTSLAINTLIKSKILVEV